MEKNLDEKLYNAYLSGEKQAFEYIYNKYKSKIEYFIYNIVKDYQKAEDLTQETFIYVMQNKLQEGSSFKYYIYLVAKSKAFNYINVEKRRYEINKQYVLNDNEEVSNDILEEIMKEETKNEVLKGIDELDEKYKNAMYLVNIEGLSYEETAKILDETLSNTKTLIHRGKKQLRKNLIKKGIIEMNKILKVLIIFTAITVLLSGIVYAVTQLYKRFNTNHNITMNPSYKSTLNENTINNLWVGTLDLAWKELAEKIGKEKIELEDENVQIAKDLSASPFTKEMLDKNDYKINIERTITNGYKVETTLNKELNFLEKFDNFNEYNWKFGESEEFIKYFGINNASSENMNKNIEILFYNPISINNSHSNDFAIKLKTKEEDEIILYRTDTNKSFEEYYKEIENKTNLYTGNREFKEIDELRIPYVRVNGMISYDELYGKEIKNSEGLYIFDTIQNVNFYLNESGCNLKSKATMVTEYLSVGIDTKYCYFQDNFIIFMKEKNSDIPYFALKIDNSDILEKKEENSDPKLIDHTATGKTEHYKKYLDGIEYKFYEDENYEYYYPSQKTEVVTVYFENGTFMTVEEALKQGKITIDLLDKYEVEYIKKNKSM